MEFIEAPFFTRCIEEYLNDSEYRALQTANCRSSGRRRPHSGNRGLPEASLAATAAGKGKRGGLRVIYCYFPEDQQIWLLTVYAKAEAADLTAAEKKRLKTAIDHELEERRKARVRR